MMEEALKVKVFLVIEKWYEDTDSDCYCNPFSVEGFVASSHEEAVAWIEERGQHCQPITYDKDRMGADGFFKRWDIEERELCFKDLKMLTP